MDVQAVWNFVRHMSEGTEIMFLLFNTRPQDGGWVLQYHMVICVSFCPSVHLCLSYIHPYIFSFPDSNLSKRQCIFTKFGICSGIVEICLRFGIANGQSLSVFYTVVCP